MPLHHYLPATYLARFSLDIKKKDRRKRIIFVGNKDNNKFYPCSVGDAGAINNLYSVIDRENHSQIIDDLWSGYEANLNKAIDSLKNKKLDAKIWIRILVPFVACMLVRGPDFDKKMTDRLDEMGFDEDSPYLSKTNLNYARAFELQRLLGPISVAKWIVAEIEGDELLITNDLGYCRFFNPFFEESGMAIPLGQKHVLMIIPRDEGDILNYVDERWAPIIYYTKLPLDNHLDLIQTLVSTAQRFIFCPSESIVKKYVSSGNYDPTLIEPSEIGFITGRNAVAHEFTWHRLASSVENEIFELGDDFPIDWEKISKGWHPYVFLAINLVEFPSAIRRKGNIVSAKFYDPDEYFILSRVNELYKMSSFELMLEEATTGLNATENQELKVKFLFARSAAFIELKLLSDSLSELEKILTIDPGNLLAKTKKAAIFLSENKTEAAFSLLDNVLKIDPNLGLARLYLADYYLMKEEFDCAIIETNASLELFPKSSMLGKVYLVRGKAFYGKGELEKAINDYSLAIDLFDKQEDLSVCFIERAFAYHELMQLNIKESNTREFVGSNNNFEQKLSLDETAQNETPYFKEVIQDLSQCIESKGSSEILESAYDLRGQLEFDCGLIDLAFEDFSEAEKLDSDNPKFPFFMGQILMNKCEFEQASQKFQRAIEINPCLGEGHSNLGIIHFLLGNTIKAEQNLVIAQSLFGEKTAASCPLRHLSHVYLTNQEIRLAKDYLKKAEWLDPESQNNKLLEAIIFVYEEDFSSSIMKLEELCSEGINTDLADVYKSIPLALIGEDDEAKELYKNNIYQIGMFNKHIFFRHLSSIATKNNESVILLEFLNDLRINHNIGLE
jgi:tetratricopeptide (TPR) repeat protein